RLGGVAGSPGSEQPHAHGHRLSPDLAVIFRIDFSTTMLKKVLITNIHTGKKHETMVDTDTNEKALIGSGVGSNETAIIQDVTGMDEAVQRLTMPKDSMDDRVRFFSGLA